jgi:hypothetical protein
MKILLLFAVIILAIQPATTKDAKGTSPEQTTPSAKRSEGTKNDSSDSRPPSVYLTVNNAPVSPDSQAETGNSYANMRIQRKLVTYTGLLVLVGVVSALVICWQSIETRRAASAAKRAAEAALLNAQAVINSERPWVMAQFDVIAGDNAAKSLFKLKAFNYGKTPAHITACDGPKAEYIRRSEGLPMPPNYGQWNWDKRFLAPRDSMPMRDLINPWEINMTDIREGWQNNATSLPADRILVIYGLIQYTDGISATPHKTAYCYQLNREKMSDMGGFLVPYGPSEYNAYT